MKKILNEVTLIRPIVILLLVITHSFTMYAGNWEMPKGVTDVKLYEMFVCLITGFRIETIALVAGYVFAFQSLVLNRKYSFYMFVSKKVKRLILPCFFFSLIYYFLFQFVRDDFSFIRFLLKLLSGVGHLWFLPMLFWCFIIIWIIDRYVINHILCFTLLLIISCLPIPTLPFALSKVPHFVIFVYIGYLLYLNKDLYLKRALSKKIDVVFLCLYVCLVFVLDLFLDIKNMSFDSILHKFLILYFCNFVKFLTATLGILSLYLFVMRFLLEQIDSYVPSQTFQIANKLCYGVYVFHQFILEYLYYHTNLSVILNSYILPFVALVITLFFSILLSAVSIKTKFGKLLIG